MINTVLEESRPSISRKTISLKKSKNVCVQVRVDVSLDVLESSVLKSNSRSTKMTETAINIKIRNQDGDEMHYRIGRNDKLYKAFRQYCLRMNVVMQGFRFLFNGRRITYEDTTASTYIQDLDVIDCVLDQMGSTNY